MGNNVKSLIKIEDRYINLGPQVKKFSNFVYCYSQLGNAAPQCTKTMLKWGQDTIAVQMSSYLSAINVF